MHTLELAVRFDSLPGAAVPELRLDVAIKSEKAATVPFTKLPIDILALYTSAHRPGEHFIWTCDCGIPACGGIHTGIRVSYTPDLVIWQVPKVPFEQAARLDFDRKAYCATITAALQEYIRYFKAYTAAGIVFEAAHDWQLNEVMTKIAD